MVLLLLTYKSSLINPPFHFIRHSFATNQLTEGTDLYIISKMMGHTDIRTTQIYTKVVDPKKEQAADAIKLDLKSDVI